MKSFLIALAFLTTTFSQAQDFAKHVNPFIGTGGHGHTFPGATVPYGMVQLSPDTRIDGSWDSCGGYHYSDNVIYGFSHTHLNGTGVSDYGDIMLMPTVGINTLDSKLYSSKFQHQKEKASAGFYAVHLDKYNIDVRLTTSTRVGFHEYTFNDECQPHIMLDLNHRDKLIGKDYKIINDSTIEIYRQSEAWARNQQIWARIEFNQPMFFEYYNNSMQNGFIIHPKKGNVKKGEKILVKVSLSPTSYEGAKLNSSEIKHWNFDKAHKAAIALWNKELSKIEVTSNDKDKLAIFYTALYHTMMQPNIAQDLDGKYRGRDNKIHVAEGFDYYTVFSLWDTFRGAHPLYTLIDKKRTADYINTFIKQYEQGGRLPVWELASNETDCMIGYHSVSVIADAMVKGIKGFDYEKAFEASKASAMRDVLGLDAYKKNGFISIDDEHESVSKTLEYAYDDWCIAQMAQLLNKQEDYQYFMKRSQNWKNIFDWETGFMRPKKNGGWDKPFDPREVNNNFTEGNSWQYSFFVPQDIYGMIEAYGGKEKFEAKLDEMFNSESKTTGREQVDVTGLIGQYAHGNEPSHHMAYLYNYVGKPEKTNAKVKYILDDFYTNTPDGLIGNEDCGQMSAWYVLSSMGIYSVTPGNPNFSWTVIEPFFEEIKVKLENLNDDVINKKLRIVDYSTFGFDSYYLRLPKNYMDIIPVPVIQSESKAFKDNLKIELKSQNSKDDIYFIINDKDDYLAKKMFVKYTKPFEISQTSTIEAYVKTKEGQSNTISATFFKKPNNYSINIKSVYNPQYHAGGPEGLLDGILGTENWRKGDWQGYQSQDFEAVVDLKEVKELYSFKANFLQDSRSWILMPTYLEFFISTDNVNFTSVGSLDIAKYSEIDPKDENSFTREFGVLLDKKKTARYVKVIAKNFGKLPEWHQGAGGDAFIFVDEVTIK
jgi:predicted alpha-1,2-mannosidase